MSAQQQRIVVKLGGAEGVDIDPLLEDVASLQGSDQRLILVHGGSNETNQLQERLGTPPRFLTSPSGQTSRRTDRATLEAFAMATALVNRRLVEGLQAREVSCLGVSGFDGRLLQARRKDAVRTVENGKVRIVRDEWTGRIEGVNSELLEHLLAAPITPVIAPLASGRKGEMLNVDGDRAAAAFAAAAHAATLVILTNVPGLLRDPEDASSLVRHVPAADMEQAEGFAQGRMRKKVMGAREALDAGVQRVIFADARREAPLRSALAGEGTVFGAAIETEVTA